jgi:hypothetical protein
MPRNQESMFASFLIYGSVTAGSKRGVVDGNGNVASIPNLATLTYGGILCAFLLYFYETKTAHGTCGSPQCSADIYPGSIREAHG